jgi:urease gamma subunit
MTEEELQQERARRWRVNGNPIQTIEDARSFLDSVGFCLLYPVRSLPVIPTFIGAYTGSSQGLPDARHAFADPRTKPAIELMVRLLRERNAYEINFMPESSLVVSAELFPFFYALTGDRNPKAAPKMKAQGAKVSPLAIKIFEVLQKKGALSKGVLRELIGGEPSNAALDRALNELWSILKITRVDYNEREGASWDLLYHWSPKAVKEGVALSLPEAISGLLGKYLEGAVAAEQEEIEAVFSVLVSRAKIRDAVHALLAAREVQMITPGGKTLIQVTPVQTLPRSRVHG